MLHPLMSTSCKSRLNFCKQYARRTAFGSSKPWTFCNMSCLKGQFTIKVLKQRILDWEMEVKRSSCRTALGNVLKSYLSTIHPSCTMVEADNFTSEQADILVVKYSRRDWEPIIISPWVTLPHKIWPGNNVKKKRYFGHSSSSNKKKLQ